MNLRHPIVIAWLVALSGPVVTVSAAVEQWADQGVPVKDGLVLWLDSTRQPAAAKAHGQTLADGQPLATWYDGSGHARDFAQPNETSRPRYSPAGVRFDGEDDHLLRDDPSAPPLEQFSAVLVVTPRSNPGSFRGFFSASAAGKNDYQTGFNVDMGREKSNKVLGFEFLNVEGNGFTGAANLFDDTTVPFDRPQSITVTVAGVGAEAIKAYLHGKLTGRRQRDEAKDGGIRADRLIVGARSTALGAAKAEVRCFLNGDVTEVLLYDRVLTDAERDAIDNHLVSKHPALADSALAAAEATRAGTAPMQRVENPPDVQVLVPGFEVRKLPVDLTNINNLSYRDDGKLVAMAYDGNAYLLSDTDGDGLEDKADLYWENASGENKARIDQPVGIALTPPGYPHGRGLFVAGKGKVSLLTDTDGDDRLDAERVVASGWPPSFVNVDAVGVAIDPKDRSVYFGLGTPSFANPYVLDEKGNTKFDIKGERGTILRVAPDLKSREIVCTGIRFSVGLAFNAAGDLFATDQEGATWAPNGNPFDELLHIQPGRHYGFPARHPKHLPGVIDEPSTFDYDPQHQSTCGITFNEPVNHGPVFGPESWRGDAIVCGESRGKLYRTKLVKTTEGYVAQNHLIASVTRLLIDATVSPRGDLVICTHSGAPDWGTGPAGKGTLYQIRYVDRSAPQPIKAWPAGPGEVRIAFDRPLDAATLAGIAKDVAIAAGRYVAAGDRFEAIRPGYAIVKHQLRAPRDHVDVASVQVAAEGRTLVIGTSPEKRAIGYSITLPRTASTTGGIAQLTQTDLAYDLSGVMADWKSNDGKAAWSGWLPHADLSVARALTAGSADHDALWDHLKTPGKLTIRTQLDLGHMLQPRVQPGSQIDFTPVAEAVTLTFSASSPIDVRYAGRQARDGMFTVTSKAGELVPVELTFATGADEPSVGVSFITQEDATPRPLALRRFFVPWAKPVGEEDGDSMAAREPVPQLAGGDWHRGRQLFFGAEAGCAKCHTMRGQGADLGPDLSNLVHRDYESVVRDIREPSGALNPDYIASTIKMKDGRVLGGIIRNVGEDRFIVRGEAEGEKSPLSRAAVKSITPSRLSVMPTGILEGLGDAKARDLLTFLLTEPLTPAPITRKGAPPPRSRAEVQAVLQASRAATDAGKAVAAPPASAATKPASSNPLRVLLVAGPKDHGPSEHDYPEWQKRWFALLPLADGVTAAQTSEWPTRQQWDAADVAVFYSANPGWTAARGAELDQFLARGGGLVFLHYAVNGREAPDALAERIGLATQPGLAYRHGPVDLTFRDANHPITRGFTSAHFVDETYWNMLGDPSRIHLLADAPEDGRPRPQLWTLDHGAGKGRVFVNILGHYNWTFDDPLYRLLVLRGICWTAGEADVDRLSGLATIGARMR